MCEARLVDLHQVAEANAHAEHALSAELSANPNKYVEPLLDACKSQKSALMDIAIDTLQKLISYKFITSHTALREDHSVPLINKIIHTICASMNVDFEDENIQLQVIKALLQAVSMCNIHGKTLRLIIKTCFNIHLLSRNLDNRRAAQGTLNQMLNVIFQKMETKQKQHETRQFRVDEGDEGLVPDTLQQQQSTTSGTQQESSSSLSTTTAATHPLTTTPTKGKAARKTAQESTTLLTIPSSHESHYTLIISHVIRSAIESVVHLHGQQVTISLSAPGALQDNDDDTASNYSHSTTHTRQSSGIGTPLTADSAHARTTSFAHHRFETQFQKDAYNIFKALCTLSQRTLPPNPLPESIELRSVILSLDLIHSILDASGPYFRSNETFLRSIQKHLCNSLLKNCVSNIPSIFNLSLKIFQTLVRNFKEQMTTQIGIFLSNAVLRILESENSSFKHKMLVIDVLQTISDHPQNLVDIFVNFDCQLKSLNLFETLVADLSHVVSHSYAEAHWVTADQEYKLKRAALRVILKIVNAIEQRMSSPPAQELTADGDGATSLEISEDGISNGRANGVSDSQHLQVSHSAHSRTDSSTSVTSPVVDFARIKQEKITLKEAIETFNEKPTKGITMLIEHQVVENTPESIANFLLKNRDLSKQKIGEFIGSEHNQEVLHQFAFMQDFSGKDFMTAFRQYLTTFRLPGEGQQIDRVVQKFAQRYYQDNPTECFVSADAAYVFAYAVIMLQTELHNPAFGNRERMTMEGFIENNKECNDGGDFPEQFQRDVYENIKNNEIKLRETDSNALASTSAGSSAGDSTDTIQNMPLEMKKQHLFDLEGKRIMKQTRKAIKWSNSHNSEFYVVTDPKYARPMFEVIWQNVLSALQFVFINFASVSELKYCIQGFEQSIRITANEYWTIPRARNAFIAKLAEQSHLDDIVTLQQKHVDCLKLLLRLAQELPDYLGTSWKSVLEIYSKLEYLQQNRLERRQSTDSRGNPIADTSALVEQNLQSMFHQIDMDITEKTFIKSSELSDESVVLFVQALCEVSDRELQHRDHPRDYSLKKMITVAHFNLNRIKIVWNRLWNPIASHFIKVACHSEQQMAMNAIVSLRQLATKFFEQGELENFHFQANFLRPFMEIIKKSSNPEMRELIVECVGNMIQLRYQNIKSGWKSIMQIFTEASKDQHAEVVRAAHANVGLVINQYFAYAQIAFVDVINCLVALCSSKHNSEWSLSNIEHIQTCAEYLAEGRLFYFDKRDDQKEGASRNSEDQEKQFTSAGEVSPIVQYDLNVKVEKPQFTDAQDGTTLWWPILTGLSKLINDERVLIRAKALEVLFQKIFRVYGGQFSTDLWKLIFKGVIVPIFDDIQHTKDVDQHTEWITTSCHKALSLLVEVFAQYFDTVHSALLVSLLTLLMSCVRKESERLSNIGHECILQLVMECWERFDISHWERIASTYDALFKKTDLNALQIEDEHVSLVSTYIKNNCVTQLNLTDAIRAIFDKCKLRMNLDTEMRFVEVLSGALTSVQQISTLPSLLVRNSAIKLSMSQVLQLDQTLSIVYLEHLFCMFGDSTNPERQNKVEQELVNTCQKMIDIYFTDCKLTDEEAAHVKNSVVILAFVLQNMARFRDGQFARHAPTFRLPFCNLISSQHSTVRDQLRTIFLRLTESFQ